MILFVAASYEEQGRFRGGAEEGGWYYTASERLDIEVFASEPEARAWATAQFAEPEEGRGRIWASWQEWNPLGTVDDPKFPSCHYYDVDIPQVPATIAAIMPEHHPTVHPHYC